MVPPRTISRALSILAIVAALLAVAVVLFPAPLSDVIFAGIVLSSVLFASVGAVGAWWNRASVLWVATLLSLGLTIAGMMSVGVFLAPTTLLLLGAAVASQVASARNDDCERIVADPPSKSKRLRRGLLGTGSILLGAGLVYSGAFSQHLFGACAQETLGCVLETTNWAGVGVTLLGLVTMAVGSWLVWRAMAVSHALDGTRA